MFQGLQFIRYFINFSVHLFTLFNQYFLPLQHESYHLFYETRYVNLDNVCIINTVTLCISLQMGSLNFTYIKTTFYVKKGNYSKWQNIQDLAFLKLFYLYP